MRTITPEEYHLICDALHELTEIMLEVGITEFKASKLETEIYWDTENKGSVNPEALENFVEWVEQHYFDRLEKGIV